MKKGKLKRLYVVNMVLPWISHIICSFIPIFIICLFGSLLPAVGVPILLGIALGLSGGGSPLGAIFYILVWNIGMFLIMRFSSSAPPARPAEWRR